MPNTVGTNLTPRGLEAEFVEALEFSGRFHVGESSVHAALKSLAERLDGLGVSYAIVGAMALNEYGYRRVTVDIDVLLAADGLRRFQQECLGRGYVERFAGSRGVRDTQHDVPIVFLLAGEFPGDGRPKEVHFPDPAAEAVRHGRYSFLPLERLLELKLASGLSAPHRLRDLADVLEVIRVRGLGEDLAERLAPSVRAKYRELWHAARSAGPDEPR